MFGNLAKMLLISSHTRQFDWIMSFSAVLIPVAKFIAKQETLVQTNKQTNKQTILNEKLNIKKALRLAVFELKCSLIN